MIVSFHACKTNPLIHASSPEHELFKVSILYPNGLGKTIDMAYYESEHMPMVAAYLGENLKFYEIDEGIAGRTSNEEIPYLAVGYFYVKNVEEYNKAIGLHIDKIIADFENYTNIQPIIQISEVKHIGFNQAN